MRDVSGNGNGLLQKIILGIAASLCIILLGVFMTWMQQQNDWNREAAERLARLETKMDMLLAKKDDQ